MNSINDLITYASYKEPFLLKIFLSKKLTVDNELPMLFQITNTETRYNESQFDDFTMNELFLQASKVAYHFMLRHQKRMIGLANIEIAKASAELAVSEQLSKRGHCESIVARYGLPKFRSLEEYYKLICDKQEEQDNDDKSDDQEEGDNDNDERGCGGSDQEESDIQNDGGLDDGSESSADDETSERDLVEQINKESQVEIEPSSSEEFDEDQDEVEYSKMIDSATYSNNESVPSYFQEFISKRPEKPADWKQVLRRYLTAISRNKRTYKKYNRKLGAVSGEMIIPGRGSNNGAKIALIVDVSASIEMESYGILIDELQAILHISDVALDVIFCNTAIVGEHSFTRNNILELKKMEVPVGGGTDMTPAFKSIHGNYECILCFTDLKFQVDDKLKSAIYPFKNKLLWIQWPCNSTWAEKAIAAIKSERLGNIVKI